MSSILAETSAWCRFLRNEHHEDGDPTLLGGDTDFVNAARHIPLRAWNPR